MHYTTILLAVAALLTHTTGIPFTQIDEFDASPELPPPYPSGDSHRYECNENPPGQPHLLDSAQCRLAAQRLASDFPDVPKPAGRPRRREYNYYLIHDEARRSLYPYPIFCPRVITSPASTCEMTIEYEIIKYDNPPDLQIRSMSYFEADVGYLLQHCESIGKFAGGKVTQFFGAQQIETTLRAVTPSESVSKAK